MVDDNGDQTILTVTSVRNSSLGTVVLDSTFKSHCFGAEQRLHGVPGRCTSKDTPSCLPCAVTSLNLLDAVDIARAVSTVASEDP
jgi:hypothetical protein